PAIPAFGSPYPMRPLLSPKRPYFLRKKGCFLLPPRCPVYLVVLALQSFNPHFVPCLFSHTGSRKASVTIPDVVGYRTNTHYSQGYGTGRVEGAIGPDL